VDAPADVEEYLAALAPGPRAALEKLRRTIRAAAPEATEALYYRMPAFRAHGRALVAYAAFTDHCSLFPLSARVIEAHAEELRPYQTSKGTIRFTANRPLPATLVRGLVQERLAENAARSAR
jgi:uncharacterized protein YdhG (YjbR/CyaY superfamily)